MSWFLQTSLLSAMAVIGVLIPTNYSQPEGAAMSFLKAILGLESIYLLHVASCGESREEIELMAKNVEGQHQEIDLEFRWAIDERSLVGW